MPEPTLQSNREQLKQFIAEENGLLSRAIRIYAWKAGLDCSEPAVSEILSEVVVEALSHAGRYDPARPAQAWLLGNAANLVRRQQAESARLTRREPLVRDLSPGDPALSEDELFERLPLLASGISDGPEEQAGMRQQLVSAIALLSAGDQKIIRLFAAHELSGNALAQAMRLTPGAARVRLHRALTRLRRIWLSDQEVDHD